MEEVQYLDEELDQLEQEMNEKYEELKKTEKKMSPITRNERINYIFDRIARAKDVLTNFRVELREVLKEGGRQAHQDFEARGKAHNAAVNKLSADLEALKAAADKRDLMKGGRKKKNEEPKGPPSSSQHIEEGKQYQEKSAAALERTGMLLGQMEEIGVETNIKLRAQTDQMKNTNADVQSVDQGMQRASKVTKDMLRKMGTDKLIMCMVLILISLIIAIIVVRVLGIDVAAILGDEINCLLESAVTLQACNTTNVTTPAPLPGPTPGWRPGGGLGGGGGGNVTSNTTTPMYVETTAALIIATTPPPAVDLNATESNSTDTNSTDTNSTDVSGEGEGVDNATATGARRLLLFELLKQEREEARRFMEQQQEQGW